MLPRVCVCDRSIDQLVDACVCMRLLMSHHLLLLPLERETGSSSSRQPTTTTSIEIAQHAARQGWVTSSATTIRSRPAMGQWWFVREERPDSAILKRRRRAARSNEEHTHTPRSEGENERSTPHQTHDDTTTLSRRFLKRAMHCMHRSCVLVGASSLQALALP
jgi:hypothetical protein